MAMAIIIPGIFVFFAAGVLCLPAETRAGSCAFRSSRRCASSSLTVPLALRLVRRRRLFPVRAAIFSSILFPCTISFSSTWFS